MAADTATDQVVDYVVRRAELEDAPAIKAGIEALMAELRGEPSAELPQGADEILTELIHHTESGLVLVAVDESASGEPAIKGLLVGSYLPSVRQGKPYLFVQDYWVAPDMRSSGVGVELAALLVRESLARGVDRAEGVYPRETFENFERTRSFYENRLSLKPIGVYARLILPESPLVGYESPRLR